MMARKKAERQMNRRGKRNVDIINDSDDLIVDMLRRMKEAAEVSMLLKTALSEISVTEIYHNTGGGSFN